MIEHYMSPVCHIILGVRIRSEGLAQVMTKRNASEYIKGSVRLYRDTHARYCRGRAKLRWACPSSVVHSSVACRGCRPRRSVSCIRVALHAVSTCCVQPEEVGHDIISHGSHMSTVPRNADSATYSP